MKKIYLLLCLAFFLLGSLVAQKEDTDREHSYKPLTVKLDDEGSKYIRFVTWHQIWAEDGNLDDNSAGFTMRIRRARFLTYAQISPRFLILSHFGLNTLNSRNMDPIGDSRFSDAPQLFLHGAWNEFRVSADESFYLGAGLHYWNGLSRITSQSTLNFTTLDNYRQAWAQLGLSDQFARHLGIYAKGKIGKMRYTLAANDPIVNALGSLAPEDLADGANEGSITYSGRSLLGDEAGFVLTGYMDYQFMDQEPNKLPYRVGSYLGKKTVFNVGAGFFNHANGTVLVRGGQPIGQDVGHVAVDVFYDAPLGEGAISAYAAYYSFDYGPNYTLGTTYGTGRSVYAHVGYVLPIQNSKGHRFMPYIVYGSQDFEAFENAGTRFQLGANWLINGHNVKVSMEYTSTVNNYTGEEPDAVSGLVIQTHIFL